MKQQTHYYAHIQIARNARPNIPLFCIMARIKRNEKIATLQQRIKNFCQRGNVIFEQTDSFVCKSVKVANANTMMVDGILDWTGAIR